jgi:carboxyl-terminal processing protease
MKWLSSKEIKYTTSVEQQALDLIETAKTEKYYDRLEKTLADLRKATAHNQAKDLETFRDEIKTLLEQEIAGRYFFEKGIIEYAFKKDKDVKEAIAILEDPERYQAILSGE